MLEKAVQRHKNDLIRMAKKVKTYKTALVNVKQNQDVLQAEAKA